MRVLVHVPARSVAVMRLLGLVTAFFLVALAWLAPVPAVHAQAASAAFATAAPPEAQRRTALVIGNSSYPNAPLVNAVNDAHAMAEVLREAGFTVLLHTEVDQRRMQLALREFGERLKAAGGTGLFFFAGHGVQIKGRNFLIPAHADIAHEDEVAYAALDAQAVLDKMESAGTGTNIVILDACRNNPFARSMRSAQQGLAQMDAPVGTLVSFATAPGSVALDNVPGLRNGLFTTHLLEAIRRPAQKVEDVLKQVRGAVLKASSNRQVPWESSALVGDFYFHPPRADAGRPAPAPATAEVAAVDTRAAVEEALWEAVRDSQSRAEVQAYLNRYPDGRHAGAARRRLLELAQPAAGGTGNAGGATEPTASGEAASAAAAALAAAAVWREEEQARWGTAGSALRPPNPRRNAASFSEGDRFRYRKLDFLTGRLDDHYLWRVDRFEPDGSLWLNEGRQRFDARGQRRGGNDEVTGVWLDLSPPLPIAEAAARGPGHSQAFATTVQRRDAEGRIERIALAGTISTHGDAVPGLLGVGAMVPAVRVWVQLHGQGASAQGGGRKHEWIHHYWFAPPLLLPAVFEIHERVDDVPQQRSRHELVAVDQLNLSAAPGAEPAAATRR